MSRTKWKSIKQLICNIMKLQVKVSYIKYEINIT